MTICGGMLVQKRVFALIVTAMITFFCLPSKAESPVLRSFIIACDIFKTRESLAPTAANNKALFENILSGDTRTVQSQESILNESLSEHDFLIRFEDALKNAKEEDISLIYFSTHGLLLEDDSLAFYLSDGQSESIINMDAVLSALLQIKGNKLLILDMCNSAAAFGKGLSLEGYQRFFARMEKKGLSRIFTENNVKFIASAGGYEPSFIWTSAQRSQGISHFALALFNGLSKETGYAADSNRDGIITLKESAAFLLDQHGLSNPYVFPEEDSFPLLHYKLPAKKPSSLISSFQMDSKALSADSKELSFSFHLHQEAKLAYQLIYQDMLGWNFRRTQIIKDEGDENGISLPGFREISLKLDNLSEEAFGHVYLQIVSIEGKRHTPIAGSLIAVLSGLDDFRYVEVPQTHKRDYEMPIMLYYSVPFFFSLNIRNEDNALVARLYSDELTRTQSINESGSPLYWNLRDLHGKKVENGTYYIELIVHGADGRDQMIRSEAVRITE